MIVNEQIRINYYKTKKLSSVLFKNYCFIFINLFSTKNWPFFRPVVKKYLLFFPCNHELHIRCFVSKIFPIILIVKLIIMQKILFPYNLTT